MSIAALISGGVDSSATVHLLKEQGFNPTLFYIKIGMEDEDGYIDCPAEDDMIIVKWLAKKYGLPYEMVSLHDEYWETVVSYVIESVKRGLTPNPDMLCNQYIKFGYFNDRWGKDFDHISTGHYASTLTVDNELYLGTAKDKVKDQTYFLGQINQLQLQKLMFPLGDLLKSEVRTIAKDANLISAQRKDSQGICFLGKIHYNDFIKRYLGEKQGKIIELETGKILGTHNGYWFYTIGQRKGIGLHGGPWFVIKKDIEENIIYVSHADNFSSVISENELRLHGFKFISNNPFNDLSEGHEIKFKIRHTSEFTTGIIRQEDNGLIHIQSDNPIMGIAPGQFGVIYDNDAKRCLGSGIIV
ncbi:MAG: tRNA 2-thiouridine(34) synthase MnmA [Bacteroidales bacterium]